MIDFWKDYDGTNSDSIPLLRIVANKHSWQFGSWEYSGLEVERIKAYCEAIGKDYRTQAINAKFMNEMEDWYLRLAKQYSAFDKIRDEVCDIDDETVLNPDSFYERKVYVRLSKVIDIIDKYREEQTEE